MIAAILANVNRDTKKRPEPFTIDDFIPGKQILPEQVVDKNEAILKALSVAIRRT